MKDLIEKARQYILQEPKCKKDIFMGLCSLNLFNAAIKEKEYKSFLSYGFIKPNVSKLVSFCISHINEAMSMNYITHHNNIVYTYAVMVFSLVSTISWKLVK